ncbi:MAG: universal stress protein [Bacteroidia bacterium]
MKDYKIETILVPTDFSETAGKALEAAIELTKKIKAKLVLIHVAEMTGLIAPVEIVTIGIINEQMYEGANEKLKSLATKIKATHGIKIDYRTYNGNVYDNIIRAAHLYNAELIIMGSYGTSGIKEWLFGSNAYRVVNNSTVPVLTINRNSGMDSFKKIVFPFNGNSLSLKKAGEIIFLAKIFNSTIRLFGFSKKLNATKLGMIMLELNGIKLTGQFERENIKCSVIIREGDDYAAEILKYADEISADIISVITYKGQSDDTILLSKPDKKLVNHSRFPVLSVPVE